MMRWIINGLVPDPVGPKSNSQAFGTLLTSAQSETYCRAKKAENRNYVDKKNPGQTGGGSEKWLLRLSMLLSKNA
jgi:hypothetical protein